jgi:glycosyltransferase involved in cell wall biosynthesis
MTWWDRRWGKRVRAPAAAGTDTAGAVTRVLFVHTATAPPLGADTWIHAQIMANLDRASYEVHAACVPGPRHEPTPTFQVLRDIPGLHLRPVDLGPEMSGRSRLGKLQGALATAAAPFHLLGLARYVRRHRISIIHTSDRPRDAFAAVLLARLTGATCIVHVHVGYGDWMSPLLKWSLKHADVLLAISQFVASTLEASGHDPSRIRVALNGIDVGRWQPGVDRDEARREFAVPDGAPLIVTVCRLFRGKGPAELIRALAVVRREHPEARLLVVGQPMEYGFAEELVELIDELDLREHVTLTGQRSDVARIMAAADIFAMPSFGEPFGLVFAEAMTMELPVVALDSGGAPEVIEDGVTGLLSAPGDQDALVANLSALVADPGRRARMGAAGRRRVQECFTSARMARDVEAVYREIQSKTLGNSKRASTDRAEADMETLETLGTEGLKRELDEHGYVVLRGVVAKEPLALLAKELYEAYDASEKFVGGGTITGHLNCFPGRSARVIYDELVARGVVDAVHAIRPDQANDIRSTMNFNLPGSIEQHYHIDGLYTDDFLICNVAVIDTDLVNGAIDLLPGTNREFIPYWKYAMHRTFRLTTRIEMKAGDVLLRKSNLWHRGMPNKSDTPRPMMSVTFGEKSAPQADPFEGDIVFYPNWYTTTRAGILRERTFAKAPVTYAAYRFAKSLRGNKGYDRY